MRKMNFLITKNFEAPARTFCGQFLKGLFENPEFENKHSNLVNVSQLTKIDLLKSKTNEVLLVRKTLRRG